jgi:DNA ligase 1
MAGEFIAIREQRGGIYLPEAALWLDPHHAVDLAVVTHAHADHVAPHRKLIATPATCHLLRSRYSHKAEHTPLAYGAALEVGGFRIQLYPAGHVLGSAMVHVTRLSDGATLLYTGDFKMQEGLSSERVQPVAADLLITECTFGKPIYTFPPYEETRARILEWCRDALTAGITPVLVGYSLGKAQELMGIFRGSDLPLTVHTTVAEMCQAYAELGVELPPYEVLGKSVPQRVLVVPPQIVKGQLLRRYAQKQTAMASGWAFSSSARFQQGVDELFPLSDHASYPDLLAFVAAVKPKRVLTTHGFCEDFARDLRQRGWDAWTLAGRDQRDLPFEFAAASEPEAPPEAFRSSPWGQFCQTAEAVAAVPGRLEKIRLLSEYLRPLSDSELPLAVRFLAGEPAASRAERRKLQTGWATIRLALREFAGLSEQAYKQISHQQNDLGRTTQLVLAHGSHQARDWRLEEIGMVYQSLAQAGSGLERTRLLREAFAKLTPAEGKFLIKVLTGDTRLGSKEGLLEEALASAFAARADEIREAHMLTGDLGETALRARKRDMAALEMRLFQPIKVMLASPGETASNIWDKLGAADGGLWVEPKMDGIRMQLHVGDGQAELFSRDLRSLNTAFPDVVEPAARLGVRAVFDGEIIAYAAGKQLTFFDLQKRLGRKRDTQLDLFEPEAVPLRCLIFDLLWLDDKPLLDLPLTARRALLEKLPLSPPFHLVPVTRVAAQEELEAAFAAALKAKQEGLMAKDPTSTYHAGRRGKTWLKLKRTDFALDCVVVKAEQGHGKRSHVLSDYTFAVRDAKDGSLKVIGKAYSGLTDAEIEELTDHFTRQTLSQEGKVRVVIPDLVLEIGFDSIQASKRHDSGLSLRFPRIRAIRRDKSAAEIDTLSTARRLAGLD